MKWKGILVSLVMVFLFSCTGDRLENEKNSSQATHIIKKGETLFSVSQKYEISVAKLKSLNPEFKDDLSGWKEGIQIILTSRKGDKLENDRDSSQATHIVKKGETLFSVSQKYQISVAELKSLNPELKDDLSGWKEGIQIVLSSESTTH